MTTVAVNGNAGGGKSAMARALAQAHGLAYFAADQRRRDEAIEGRMSRP